MAPRTETFKLMTKMKLFSLHSDCYRCLLQRGKAERHLSMPVFKYVQNTGTNMHRISPQIFWNYNPKQKSAFVLVSGDSGGPQGPLSLSLTRALHSLIVVGVDADLLLLGTKWELTTFQRLQFMVALEVGPAPHTAINDVR